MLSDKSNWKQTHLRTIYIYVEMIGCSESNSMLEICEKLDKSNT